MKNIYAKMYESKNTQVAVDVLGYLNRIVHLLRNLVDVAHTSKNF